MGGMTLSERLLDDEHGLTRDGIALARLLAVAGDARGYASVVGALVALAKLEVATGGGQNHAGDNSGSSATPEDRQSDILRIARDLRA